GSALPELESGSAGRPIPERSFLHVESMGLPRCPPGREGGQGEGQLLRGLVRPGRSEALSKLRAGGGGPERGLQAPREAASRAAKRHLPEQQAKKPGKSFVRRRRGRSPRACWQATAAWAGK